MRIGILTVSDRSARGERPDASGPALVEAVQRASGRRQVVHTGIVPDDQARDRRRAAATGPTS